MKEMPYLTTDERDRLVKAGLMSYPKQTMNTAMPPVNKSLLFGKVDHSKPLDGAEETATLAATPAPVIPWPALDHEAPPAPQPPPAAA